MYWYSRHIKLVLILFVIQTTMIFYIIQNNCYSFSVNINVLETSMAKSASAFFSFCLDLIYSFWLLISLLWMVIMNAILMLALFHFYKHALQTTVFDKCFLTAKSSSNLFPRKESIDSLLLFFIKLHSTIHIHMYNSIQCSACQMKILLISLKSYELCSYVSAPII